jgi:hypothetical protein
MPHVIVTEYEITHDLLPPVCVKCGGPATERFKRKIRLIDEPGRWRGFYMLAFVVGIFFFPPLVIFVVRRARSLPLRIPYCGPDLARFRRQERIALIVLIPVWALISLSIDAFLLSSMIFQPGATCGAVAVVAVWLLLFDIFSGWRARRKAKKPTTVRMPGVHANFVAALLEDRARDRVDNPARRGGFGDIRDDFDDSPA